MPKVSPNLPIASATAVAKYVDAGPASNAGDYSPMTPDPNPYLKLPLSGSTPVLHLDRSSITRADGVVCSPDALDSGVLTSRWSYTAGREVYPENELPEGELRPIDQAQSPGDRLERIESRSFIWSA